MTVGIFQCVSVKIANERKCRPCGDPAGRERVRQSSVLDRKTSGVLKQSEQRRRAAGALCAMNPNYLWLLGGPESVVMGEGLSDLGNIGLTHTRRGCQRAQSRYKLTPGDSHTSHSSLEKLCDFRGFEVWDSPPLRSVPKYMSGVGCRRRGVWQGIFCISVPVHLFPGSSRRLRPSWNAVRLSDSYVTVVTYPQMKIT